MYELMESMKVCDVKLDLLLVLISLCISVNQAWCQLYHLIFYKIIVTLSISYNS